MTKYTVKVTDDLTEWYRAGGPAIACATGVAWYVDGKLHREDGPAEIYSSGVYSWYWQGKKLTKDEFGVIQRYGDGVQISGH